MITSQGSKQDVRKLGQSGFTLMELAIVITILAISALIVLPLLPETDAANLKNSARATAAEIRYLGERSITTKTRYRLRLDLDNGKTSVIKMVNGEETVPEDPFLSRNVLAEGVGIEDVEVQGLGKLGEGVVDLDFGVAGLADFVVIHLKGARDGRFTVTALPNGGRVECVEGYREIDS
jgi:general secretion pathway protein H